MSAEVRKRIMSRIKLDGECWLWQGQINPHGYGRFSATEICSSKQAHRISYETFIGPIETGYELHHKCETKACVNPDHLEPVDPREHTRLSSYAEGLRNRTHCAHGHEWTEENSIYVTVRRCRQCRRKTDRLAKRKRRAA